MGFIEGSSQRYRNTRNNKTSIKLFDYVDIVVAPVLIGGKNTSTLIDGSSITNVQEIGSLGFLQLESSETLHFPGQCDKKVNLIIL